MRGETNSSGCIPPKQISLSHKLNRSFIALLLCLGIVWCHLCTFYVASFCIVWIWRHEEFSMDNQSYNMQHMVHIATILLPPIRPPQLFSLYLAPPLKVLSAYSGRPANHDPKSSRGTRFVIISVLFCLVKKECWSMEIDPCDMRAKRNNLMIMQWFGWGWGGGGGLQKTSRRTSRRWIGDWFGRLEWSESSQLC